MSTHRYACVKARKDPESGIERSEAVLEISGPHQLEEAPSCPSCGDPMELLEEVLDPEPEEADAE